MIMATSIHFLIRPTKLVVSHMVALMGPRDAILPFQRLLAMSTRTGSKPTQTTPKLHCLESILRELMLTAMTLRHQSG